jgi:hypothetical protein
MSLRRPTVLDQPLECLFEEPGLPTYRIPQALIELYGGSIGFPELCLYSKHGRLQHRADGGRSFLRGPARGRAASGRALSDGCSRLVSPAREGTRKSLIDGADVLGRAGAAPRLLTLRRHRSYVFLRYRLSR